MKMSVNVSKAFSGARASKGGQGWHRVPRILTSFNSCYVPLRRYRSPWNALGAPLVLRVLSSADRSGVVPDAAGTPPTAIPHCRRFPDSGNFARECTGRLRPGGSHGLVACRRIPLVAVEVAGLDPDQTPRVFINWLIQLAHQLAHQLAELRADSPDEHQISPQILEHWNGACPRKNVHKNTKTRQIS
jgi:hypothetical protein